MSQSIKRASTVKRPTNVTEAETEIATIVRYEYRHTNTHTQHVHMQYLAIKSSLKIDISGSDMQRLTL